MATVRGFVDINRPVEDVFAYTANPVHRSTWQDSVENVRVETAGPTAVGTQVRETRRVTGGPRTIAWTYTGYETPKRWSFLGTEGPVRPIGTMTFIGQDEAPMMTRVEMDIDFQGHGIGRLFTSLARRDARKQVPRDLARLKRELER